MNAFVNAVRAQEARTENNMRAFKSTLNANVDLFFKIGAMRGQDVIPAFVAAYVEDRDMALRIAQWARDIRGGSGERKIFRDILNWLEKNDKDAAIALLNRTPELGRWDDVLVVEETDIKQHAFRMVQKAIEEGNGLAAKWMPRKGKLAVELRNFLGMTPKQYRKTLVRLTKVVEQQMCAKDWDNINFSQVPSLAHARYKKAFNRNTPKYAEYVAELMKPVEQRDPKVKVNAAAVYPYDVLKGRIQQQHYNYGSYYGRANYNWSKTELDLIEAQWEALPNYVGDASVLAMVDVSWSMTATVGQNLTALEVAVSLGLYVADKNRGPFKDTFLTFSGRPELVNLMGRINQKIDQMTKSHWEMNTNLHSAFETLLKVAKMHNVPEADMPKMLLILSDMQFDWCVRFDDTAFEMIRRKYEKYGYQMPTVVFWNLKARDNVPVRFDQNGVALVSGFSPSILKEVLSAKMDDLTPEGIMRKTVMVDRYNYRQNY